MPSRRDRRDRFACTEREASKLDTEPASLDPEEGQNGFFALLSAALGLLSLRGAIVPMCGARLGLLGLIFGPLGRLRASRMETVGAALSALGILIEIVYAAFVYVAGSPE